MANKSAVLTSLKVDENEAVDLFAKSRGDLVSVDYNGAKSLGAALTEINEAVEGIPTNTSDLNNDSDFATKEEVNTAISTQIGRVYKPSGTVEYASLPTPSQENLGNVYNVSNAFTTDERFVDGPGKKYPAGSNVAVVQAEAAYKFDVLSGEIDLSNYVEKDGNKQLSTEDFTSDFKSKLEKIPDEVNSEKVAEWDAKADTTAASEEANGLMSKEDKKRLNTIGGVRFGESEPEDLKPGDLFIKVEASE